MDRVAVGSTNPVKIRAVEKAWRIKAEAVVKGLKVETGIPKQPIGFSETLRGAFTRAKAASSSGGYDYGVGIEAGIMPFPSKSGYIDLQVAIIVGPGGQVSLGLSPGFELPSQWVKEIIFTGKELEETAIETFKLSKIGDRIGVIGKLTSGVITRVDLTYNAVVMALLPWINKETYGPLITIDEFEDIIGSQIF